MLSMFKKLWAGKKEIKVNMSSEAGSSTSLPSSTALGTINYPLKYTAEVLSAWMRPREKGKLHDPMTYKLLTPGLSPGLLPVSVQKKPESNITFGLCLCDPYTCCHSRCLLLPFISIHLRE